MIKTKLILALTIVALLAAPLWAKGPKRPKGPSASSGITEVEKANILYLYEEEKLAHDIYVQMYNTYGAFIFDNISESEERHMAAVAKLIIKYGLDTTILGNEPSTFSNGDIQDLYGQLLAKGQENLISALEVDVEIEEMDIADIERMLEETDKRDIKRVLTNLLNSSNNHLDAFNTQLGLVSK